MTNDKQTEVEKNDIMSFLLSLASATLLMSLFIGLLYISDKDWHEENDICNSTCLNHINERQHLMNYEKFFKISDYKNITCICSIKECDSEECTIFEKKTLYINSP